MWKNMNEQSLWQVGTVFRMVARLGTRVDLSLEFVTVAELETEI